MVVAVCLWLDVESQCGPQTARNQELCVLMFVSGWAQDAIARDQAQRLRAEQREREREQRQRRDAQKPKQVTKLVTPQGG